MPKKIKDLLKKEFMEYLSLLSKEEIPVPSMLTKVVATGDLRRLGVFPPIYTLVVDELSFYNEKLFKCVILTEEVPLGWLGDKTPIIKLERFKTLLVVLPFWAYFLEDFLYQFSEKLGSVSQENLSKAVEYAERKIIPETVQGEYIKTIMKRLSPFNTYSLLQFLDQLEAYEETPQVIKVSSQVGEALEEYAFQKAAAEKNVFKGKNFLAIVEKLKTHARLIIYLPQEYLGKKAVIKLKDKVIFEGELQSDRLILEPLSLLLDYSFLEEELDVQV